MAVKDIFHLQTIIAFLWVNKHLHIKGRSRRGARHNSTAHKATAPGTSTLLSHTHFPVNSSCSTLYLKRGWKMWKVVIWKCIIFKCLLITISSLRAEYLNVASSKFVSIFTHIAALQCQKVKGCKWS